MKTTRANNYSTNQRGDLGVGLKVEHLAESVKQRNSSMENRHYNDEELYATAQHQLRRGDDIDFTADQDEEESEYEDSLDSLEALQGQYLGRAPIKTSTNMLIVPN